MSEGSKETEEPRIIWRREKPDDTQNMIWVQVKDSWKRNRTGWKAVPRKDPQTLDQIDNLSKEPPYFPTFIEKSLPKED